MARSGYYLTVGSIMPHGRVRASLGLLSVLLIAIPLNIFFVAQAAAWGELGHQIICQIAYTELKPEIKARVDALIAIDPKFRTFADACTWPDKFPRIRSIEHFLNVPRTDQGIDPAHLCPLADRCVASAILNDTRDLAFSADVNDQLRLLKSLGHWVGDIHQPFHVSFEDDKGGNAIQVTGLCPRNLHSVWDSCIIERKIGPDHPARAEALEREISDEDRKAWIPAEFDSSAVAAWANESLAISLRPSVQYCVLKNGACWYSNEAIRFPARPRSVDIDDAYLELHAPLVRERLKRAGVRLAAILNTVLQNS